MKKNNGNIHKLRASSDDESVHSVFQCEVIDGLYLIGILNDDMPTWAIAKLDKKEAGKLIQHLLEYLHDEL